MKSLLVASVQAGPPGMESDVARLLSRAASADLVELRVDSLRTPDLERLLELGEQISKPLLLTCRSKREGGAFEGSEEERLAISMRAIELGFDYVDVEIDALQKPLSEGGKKSRTKLVLSHHDFEGIPEDLDLLVERALSLGADVVKIAARVSSLEESLHLAKAGERVRAVGKAFAPVPLGPAGASGRILANRLGSVFSYAPIDATRPTGPGQVSLEDLKDIYRFSEIGDATEIYGILGAGALESLSPAMHNRFFQRVGRNAVYVPFQETELSAFVRAARTIGVAGLSVTLPFKEEILGSLEEVDDEARAIGAVNTVIVRDGRWKGYNTDVRGVLEPLAAFAPLRGRKAVVVGAGGAARAAAHALVGEGSSVLVLARTESRAASVAKAAGCEWGPLSRLDSEYWDLLVNATPVSPLEGSISEKSIVFDMVTVPERTPLIRKARDAGAS
ncbi:MAG: type I 3-dehydroquinate dehydratase, partial [Vicinamibacteria bacterium]